MYFKFHYIISRVQQSKSHFLTLILSHKDRNSSIYAISEKQIILQLCLPQSHKLYGSYEKKCFKYMEKVKQIICCHTKLFYLQSL